MASTPDKETEHDTVWHPFTQAKRDLPPVTIEKARGTCLYDSNGKSYIDAVSSWWVNLHGHAHPHITNALKTQLESLHQVIFAGCTHAPAKQLCKRLSPLVPIEKPHFFFSDNGSTAIEVALKMAIQYSKQTGKTDKKRIIFLEDAYHGDTFGAMSVSEKSFFTAPFNEFLFDAVSIPGPSKDPSKTLASLHEECGKGDVMAMIYEPLIQGASGMQFYQADTLQNMIAVCKEHAVLSIADEVFTGFGRTGTLFASNQSSHKPDILCLSKALTGGTLPLGLTIASEKVWEVFQSDKKEHMLLHGHSFTGNPLSCTAALASLDLTEKEDFNISLRRISSFYETHKKDFEDHPGIENVRHKGLVFAFDIQASDQGYGSTVKDILYPYFIEQGVLLRPLGNVIYMVPPVCITDQELAVVFKVMKDGIDFLSSQ